MEHNTISLLAKQIENNDDVALVLVTKTDGSSPRGSGSIMAVDREGKLLGGTIGGGAVEERAKKDAIECINRGISQSFKYELKKDADIGMVCGGDMEIFVQVFNSKDKLLIVGGGHIGLSLYKFAKNLGYSITIVDNRGSFVTKDRFPDAQLLVGDIVENLKKYSFDQKTNVVIVTHGHEYDQDALEIVVRKPSQYIGMIGSSRKIKACYNNLKKKGINIQKLEKVHAPIGLDIGGDKPEEIALAIMAEIQAVKHDRQGGFLNNK